MITEQDILEAKVLIIDDQTSNIMLMEQILEIEGFTCFQSITDPLQALQKYTEFQPDVILLDLKMPHMDGFEVMAQLKGSEKNFYTPVLVLTGQTDRATRIRALDQGASDFLGKPFDTQEVVTRIHHVLEIRLLHKRLQNQNKVLEERVQERTVELTASNKELQEYRDHLEKLVQQRTGELSALNKELEVFSYSVSHDLMAPVRRIIAFGDSLLSDYADSLNDEGKNFLQRIVANTIHMQELIDGLLELSRLNVKMTKGDVDLSAMADEIFQELRGTYPDCEVETVVEKELHVNGDSKLTRVLLLNLLSNAWKFTQNAPHAKIEVGKTNYKDKLVYFVRDNGAGFDMDYADKLFQPFSRLHTTEEFPGTGIGLATVKRVINRHGGQIWAEGEVDKGAVFYFAL